MAWAPSTDFEDDLVDLQPGFNLIQGQLAYEAANQYRDNTPRPQSTYEYLAKRDKRNKEIEEANVSKTKEISASLAMLERIQEIAGTKPLGEHATMADWEDRSTVEKEAVAMMRHFGMMSMADGSLSQPKPRNLPKDKVIAMRNGNRSFPLILDPEYFEPGRTRKTSKPSSSNQTPSCSSSSVNTYATAKSESIHSSCDTVKSHLDDTKGSMDSYVDIQYELLQTSTEEPEPQQPSKPKETKKGSTRGRGFRRAPQKERMLEQKQKKLDHS